MPRKEQRMEQLKKGQRVVIKSAKLSGTVIGSRPAGEDEDVLYKVQISEQTMFFRRDNLESWPELDAKLQRGSKEWLHELTRFNEVGMKYIASPHDQKLLRQLVESGAKLGFFIPIE